MLVKDFTPAANVTGPAGGDRAGNVVVAVFVAVPAVICLAVAACTFARWRQAKKFAVRHEPARPLESATSVADFDGWCIENNMRSPMTGVMYRWDPPEAGAAAPIYIRGTLLGYYWCARGRVLGGEYVWNRYYPGTTYAVRFRGDAAGDVVTGSWTSRAIVDDIFSRSVTYEGGFSITLRIRARRA